MTLNFNLQGTERKNLVAAISEALDTPKKYLGPGKNAFQIDEYNVDKDGTLTGPDDFTLVGNLLRMGFTAQNFDYEADETETAEPQDLCDIEQPHEDWENCAEDFREIDDLPPKQIEALADEADSLVIEIPNTGFTPEKLDILCRMVTAKAPLLKAALGVDDRPIQYTTETLRFPWFSGELDAEHTEAYATLISLLCKTSLTKARVTAKEKELDSSPKFSFRVWLISLGMVGSEFKNARRVLLAKLPGNSAWKAGCKPETATTEGNLEGVSADNSADTAETETEVADDGLHA